MARRIASTLQRWSEAPPLRSARAALFRLAHPAAPRFTCPVCGYRGPFVTANVQTGTRPHASCPKCRSAERHRLQHLVVRRLLDRGLLQGRSCLHLAPERFFVPWFRGIFDRYVTADLGSGEVDCFVDVRALPFRAGAFDVVYASHVLEHVKADAEAIAEIRRVLAPQGIAILPVPILSERTVEYGRPSPLEFGHVRCPGPDYFDRYRAQFARVEVFTSNDFAAEHQTFMYEDRSAFPNAVAPERPPMTGTRHADFVPVCFA